jgi:hypothetical protein
VWEAPLDAPTLAMYLGLLQSYSAAAMQVSLDGFVAGRMTNASVTAVYDADRFFVDVWSGGDATPGHAVNVLMRPFAVSELGQCVARITEAGGFTEATAEEFASHVALFITVSGTAAVSLADLAAVGWGDAVGTSVAQQLPAEAIQDAALLATLPAPSAAFVTVVHRACAQLRDVLPHMLPGVAWGADMEHVVFLVTMWTRQNDVRQYSGPSFFALGPVVDRAFLTFITNAEWTELLWHTCYGDIAAPAPADGTFVKHAADTLAWCKSNSVHGMLHADWLLEATSSTGATFLTPPQRTVHTRLLWLVTKTCFAIMHTAQGLSQQLLHTVLDCLPKDPKCPFRTWVWANTGFADAVAIPPGAYYVVASPPSRRGWWSMSTTETEPEEHAAGVSAGGGAGGVTTTKTADERLAEFAAAVQTWCQRFAGAMGTALRAAQVFVEADVCGCGWPLVAATLAAEAAGVPLSNAAAALPLVGDLVF